MLILAAITASFLGANRRKRRPVLWGSLAGLAISVLTFLAALTLLDSLHRYGEKLEAIVGVVAVVVLLLVMNWFFHRVYWTEWISSFHKRRKVLLARSESSKVAFFSAQAVGLFLLGLTSVYREGFETVLFLQSLELSAGPRATVLGALVGLAGVAVVAVRDLSPAAQASLQAHADRDRSAAGFVLLVMVGSTSAPCRARAGYRSTRSTSSSTIGWHLAGCLPVLGDARRAGGRLALVVGSYFAAEYVGETPTPAEPAGPPRQRSSSSRPTPARRRREGAASPR